MAEKKKKAAAQPEAPDASAPNTNAPNTNAPNTNAPNTNAPNTNAPNTNAPNTNAPRDDAALKEAVLAAAMPDAAFDGFTDANLAKAGKAAGVAADELVRLFPEGPLSLIEFYSLWTDGEMEKLLAAMDLPKMKIRERIAAAVLARLSVMRPHKEAARRAGATLSLPMHAGMAARLLYHSVDAMWRAVGDTATDFNFYTKRGILAGVYGATLLRWFNDPGADETITRDFLAARIENVMQFEKFKGQAKKVLANFPNFADFAKPRTK
jgi:ubiquinone biosynthesis protein COQ9